MGNLTSKVNKFLFLFCFLPLISLADCEQSQGPISFDNIWRSTELKWICPQGVLVIGLDDYSHYTLQEYMHMRVKSGAPTVKLTMEKRDPGPNPQITLLPNDHMTQSITFDASPNPDNRTFDLPAFTTGQLDTNGSTRQLIITNINDTEICISGPNSCID